MSKRPTPDEVLHDIRKKLPGVKIMRASDPAAQLQTQAFGIPELDELTGGMLCGGFTTLWGPEKAGKSSIACRATAQAQRDGRRMLWVDLEGRFDPSWAQLQGADLDELWIQNCGQDLEANLDAVNELIREGAIDGLVIDSIIARASRAELMDKNDVAKSIAKDTIANIPKKLSQWFRVVSALMADKKIPAILLSQVRTYGLGSGMAYSAKSGGNALSHWGSTELKISRHTQKIEATKQGEKLQLGYWMRCELKKTSLNANEGKQILLPFYFGIGVDDIACAVRSGIDKKIITRGGTGRITFEDSSWPSENNLVEKARENSELGDAIIQAVAAASQDAIGGETAVIAEAEEDTMPVEAPPEEFVCLLEECGQVFGTARGLKGHQTKMHKEA